MASDFERKLHLSLTIPDDVWARLNDMVKVEVESYMRSERFIEDTREIVRSQAAQHLRSAILGYGSDREHPLKQLLNEAASSVLEDALRSLREGRKP